ncbi:hypothetical protein ASD38_02405 [Caulobacter sp. Root487D2Y]|uniref:glycosyltransferase n=1 Tax=Caulobacter sp. Root487D2Y TaxID=1736547 RepID=UPI0006FDB623|nr:glycosyltransferase [Caulobacter sp. Root487D2Y]KQY35433.1 hypothetical protein ASD38_02405 [Caulobacter sp. Root487D2Y]
MKVAYFVHDLEDAAVRRRVRMLRAGGCEVAVLGFRRAAAPVDQVEGVPATDLGRTHNARLAQRAAAVAVNLLKAGRLKAQVAGADVVLARNLECLALAAWARELHAPGASLVYECLDIHRTLLGAGLASRALRAVERGLLARCAQVIVSSPAFVERYFAPRQDCRAPVLLIENKVLADVAAPARPDPDAASSGPPWRIGWFGMIRCRKSLDLLTRLVERGDGLIEVVIRGRPSYDVLSDFDAVIARTPGLRFGGPYRPEALPDLYRGVHFTWAVDYFEEGLNSSWLLPNRLYEGGLNGVPAIALDEVETGRWLARRGAGVLISDPERELPAFFEGLTEPDYVRRRRATCAIPLSDLVADRADCRRLATSLGGAR